MLNNLKFKLILYAKLLPLLLKSLLALFESKSAEFNLRVAAESKPIPKLDQFVVSISAPIEVQREKIKSEIQSLLSQEIKPEKVADVYDRISSLSGELSRMDRSAAMSCNLASNVSPAMGDMLYLVPKFMSKAESEILKSVEVENLKRQKSGINPFSDTEKNLIVANLYEVKLEKIHNSFLVGLDAVSSLSVTDKKASETAKVTLTNLFENYGDKLKVDDIRIYSTVLFTAIKNSVPPSHVADIIEKGDKIIEAANKGNEKYVEGMGIILTQYHFSETENEIRKTTLLRTIPTDKLEKLVDSYFSKQEENDIPANLYTANKTFRREETQKSKEDLIKAAIPIIGESEVVNLLGKKDSDAYYNEIKSFNEKADEILASDPLKKTQKDLSKSFSQVIAAGQDLSKDKLNDNARTTLDELKELMSGDLADPEIRKQIEEKLASLKKK